MVARRADASRTTLLRRGGDRYFRPYATRPSLADDQAHRRVVPASVSAPNTFKSYVLVEPPARREVRRRLEAETPRLFERGDGARAPGRLRRRADIVSSRAARPAERHEDSSKHGHRVHEDESTGRSDSVLSQRARAAAGALGGALRARVSVAQAWRARHSAEAPRGVLGQASHGRGIGALDQARRGHPATMDGDADGYGDGADPGAGNAE